MTFRRRVLIERWGATSPLRDGLTGNCPIREHTGDGAYVGRCDFACYGGVCPRHGVVADYPTRDDREVAVDARRFA
jgi:hypothetical protein